MKRKKDISVVVASVLLGLILVGGGILMALVLNPSENYTSEDLSGEEHRILYCKSASPKDAFFEPTKDYTDAMHEIKFKYTGKNIDSASYNYNATFSDESVAKAQSSQMQWDYNEYMAAAGIYQEDLTPVFTYDGDIIRVGLFFEKKNLVSNISDLLFLNKEEFNQAKKYAINELSRLYKSKNFACKISEFND